jgi:hypothetical protein
MRCTCCNATLTDYEVTLRHAVSKQFIEMCSGCLKDTEIPIQVRNDLMSGVDLDVVESLLDGDDDDFYDEPTDTDDYDEYWNER